jgi:type IV pilus assembly protein PilC
MPSFNYRALDKGGKEIRGRIDASSEATVIEKLRSMGYYPTDVSKAKGQSVGQQNLEELPIIRTVWQLVTRGKVKSKTLTMFTRQLATLIGAGLPLLRSLRILEEQVESSNLKNCVSEVADDVEGGTNFSEALSRHPQVFSKLYVNMIKAGEIGGALEQVLERLALFAEKSQALRSKVMSALYYPIIVIIIASIIVGIVLTFVVPRFQEFWDEAGAELPGPTQILVTASEIIRNKALAVVLFVAALGIFYRNINNTDRGKFILDTVKLRLPVFGTLIQKAAVARFARTFGTLLDTGVPILQSLVIVKDTSGNEVVARAMVDIHNSIREGETVSEPMRQHSVFPPLVVHMIAVGEETGAIDQMLVKVAEAYEREVDSTVEGLTSLLEPLLIVMLGIIIGFIVIALYLPLFNIGDIIQA